MSKTTAINTAATSERELTIDELDTVSGGEEFTVTKLMDAATPKLYDGGGDGGGGAGPAIGA